MTRRIPPILAAALSSLGLIIAAASSDLIKARDVTGGRASNDSVALPWQHAPLTFADRVEYQRAIEEVYWGHRIWPKERPDPKPSLDEIMPRTAMEQKVHDYLRDAQLLDYFWPGSVTPEMLQGELDRMARESQRPHVLKEIFAALHNDPNVIAQCLVRPALSKRLLAQRYANDRRFHGEMRRVAEEELQTFHSLAALKASSGKYREIEWTKAGTDKAEGSAPHGSSRELKAGEWNSRVEKLGRILQGGKPAGAPATIRDGAISRLQEDDERFYVLAVMSKTESAMRLALVEWPKRSLADLRTSYVSYSLGFSPTVSANYRLPTVVLGSGGCIDDTWKPTVNVPGARESHTAIWTGSEMIVWGGLLDIHPNYLNSGERYDPAIDVWTPISTANAPTGRQRHTVVWTGSEMIVWGGDTGFIPFNSGGKYNPSTDTWTATSTANAPLGRQGHTAVWTGTQMIVWGGSSFDGSTFQDLNTGGRYFPLTDTWLPTSIINAPSIRNSHTAVWTGLEMIIWGGLASDGSSHIWDTGGRYNPATDTWLATSLTNVPAERFSHTAVWTGSQMIIWGGANGTFLDTGGLYNPLTDTWTATSTNTAPLARTGHTAIWNGSEMIVWGGDNFEFDLKGGRYNPSTDTWTPTTALLAPSYRVRHTAVWTGSEMIIFGGGVYRNSFDTGGRYNPASDTWNPTRATNAPEARTSHTATWTGSEMIVWGGSGAFDSINSGGIYEPATDTWTAPNNSGATPLAREDHTAIWTGTEMIVWGGWAYSTFEFFNTGGRYDPALDRWGPISTVNAPLKRRFHTAIWTGSEMIVWGGESGSTQLNTGGRYNPNTNTWAPTTTANAPMARRDHTAVWTGSEMIVWGGDLNTGGKYNPVTDHWIPTSTVNAPAPLSGDIAVWTGNEMIVSGGGGSGGRYRASSDSWRPISLVNQPEGRAANTTIWTGREMIIWGGQADLSVNTGGRYDPGTNTWRPTSLVDVPSARQGHTAVWTGKEMIVWGGVSYFGFGNFERLRSGSAYSARVPIPPVSAVSRKSHGGSDFAIPLPFSGSPGIECRAGGATDDYTVIVTFHADLVTIDGSPQASVTSGTGTIGSGGVSNGGVVAISGDSVTVPLTGVANAQTINVTLHCVNGASDVVIPMSRLLGDTTGNGTVNATDVGQTKGQSGQPLTAANFRNDVNASGSINATDIGQVKAQSGTVLP
jgi:N-acetylneuraminic acid mutarotase